MFHSAPHTECILFAVSETFYQRTSSSFKYIRTARRTRKLYRPFKVEIFAFSAWYIRTCKLPFHDPSLTLVHFCCFKEHVRRFQSNFRFNFVALPNLFVFPLCREKICDILTARKLNFVFSGEETLQFSRRGGTRYFFWKKLCESHKKGRQWNLRCALQKHIRKFVTNIWRTFSAFLVISIRAEMSERKRNLKNHTFSAFLPLCGIFLLLYRPAYVTYRPTFDRPSCYFPLYRRCISTFIFIKQTPTVVVLFSFFLVSNAAETKEKMAWMKNATAYPKVKQIKATALLL